MTDWWEQAFSDAWNNDPLTDLEKVAKQSWENQKGPLERLYDHLNPEWEKGPKQTTYKIYGYDGKPIYCCICDECDHWVVEGAPNRVVMVCDHGAVDGLAFRQLDSKVVPTDVARWEVAELGELEANEDDDDDTISAY